jgi:hypothetical protein
MVAGFCKDEDSPAHLLPTIGHWSRSSKLRIRATWLLVCISLLLSQLFLSAQPNPAKPPSTGAPPDQRAQAPGPFAAKPPPATSGSQLKPNDAPPLVRPISPGLFEVGSVTLDQQHRTVSFPAVLNSSSGQMEYLLVTSYGKVHESILKTDASPYHIHIAMLLLGAKGQEADQASRNSLRPTLGPIKNPSKEILPGDRVSISVSWKVRGAEIQHPVEELVLNQQTHSSPESESWVYNGSCVMDGRFLAQSEGSIVSLITDPVALVNNTGPGHDNDQIWAAATNNLPPVDVPIEVRIKLSNSLP